MTSEISIHPDHRDRDAAKVIAFILKCRPGRKLKVVVSEVKATRSDAQNAALWAVAYPPLMEFMGYRGEEEREALHSFFCGEFWGWKEIDILGKRKLIPKRTTTCNEGGDREVIPKLLFCEFFAFIQQRGAENGVYIPDPDPEWFRQDEKAVELLEDKRT